MASGDTCSRAQLVGAILGAALGGPPSDWIDKMDAETMAKMDAAAGAIAKHAADTAATK